jgi:O-glycosyl hydrolase
MLKRCLFTGGVALLVILDSAWAQTAPRVDRVILGETRQTIEGWGASLATWDEASRYSDARWLATWQDLGLNILRINLVKSVLRHPSGRLDVPVPISADLEATLERMDFSIEPVRLYGEHARWLREHALEPERVLIVGSVWSPPHWMKGPTGMSQNWLGITDAWPTPWLSGEHLEWQEEGHGDSIGGRLQTEDPDTLLAYGRYLAAWVTGFENTWDVPLHAISIQNESLFENPFDSMTVSVGPDGNEDYGQYALLLDSVRSAWREYDIDTRIKGPHPAMIGPSPENPWSLVRTARLIEAVDSYDRGALLDFLDYFNSNYYMPANEGGAMTTAAFYLGRSAVEADWARWAFAPGVRQYGKPVWISEAGGEQTSWSTMSGDRNAMESGAVTVAVKIFNALVHADAVSYIYWLITDGEALPGDNTLLGTQQLDDPLASAKFTAFRHFTRFIRPGAQRIDAVFQNGYATTHGASQYDALNALSVAAFRHEADGSFTLVGLNMTAEKRRIGVSMPPEFANSDTTAWISSETQRFAPLQTNWAEDGSLELDLEPLSIVTVTTNSAPAD